VIDFAGLSNDAPYLAWTFDAAGDASNGQVVGADAVRGLIAQARQHGGVVLVAGLVGGGRQDLRRRFDGLLPDEMATTHVAVRPLTGPYVVAADWQAPIGADGWVVGDLRARADDPVPLVLAGWTNDFGDLESFAGAVEARKAAWKMVSPAHVRTLLERLVAADDGPADQAAKLRYAAALRRCEQVVDEFELAFRSGEDFTADEHTRIELLMQELVLRKDAFPTDGMRAERLGLESRLSRLLDAQASRDAGGTLERVLSALTAFALVPGVVAGVFGANVPIPFHDLAAMRFVMFAFMAAGGVLSYLLLSSVRQSSITREVQFRPPGERRRGETDLSWRARVAFAALTGASIGVAGYALCALWSAGAADVRSSTTFWSLVLVTLALVGVVGVLFVRDVEQRSWLHAAVSVPAAVGAGLATSALLRSDLTRAAIAVVILVAVACAVLAPRLRAWFFQRARAAGAPPR
jgi:hypothetical protein